MNINIVQASGISDGITGADDFLQAGQSDEISINSGKLRESSAIIVNILIAAGTITAVVVASVLGIQFMLGSIEEKAKVREALISFVIGCVVVFGAFAIWKIFVNILNTI